MYCSDHRIPLVSLSRYTVKKKCRFFTGIVLAVRDARNPRFSQPHIIILQSSVNLQVPVIDHLVI